MALIVEDGTIVSNANTYVSEAEFTSFLSARRITLSGDYTSEQLILIAMDYVESLSYKGVKMSHNQALQWPRQDVYIDGYYNNVDNIPKQLKNGLMQTAAAVDAGNSPQAVLVRKTIKEKVGDLEVQYSESSNASLVDPKIIGFLYKLLMAGGHGSANSVANKG